MFSHAGWDLVFCAFGQIGHRSAAVFSGGRDKRYNSKRLAEGPCEYEKCKNSCHTKGCSYAAFVAMTRRSPTRSWVMRLVDGFTAHL